MACAQGTVTKIEEDHSGKVFGLYLVPWDSVRLRTASTHWNVPGKYGPHGELFFFLIVNKEPMVLRKLVEYGPCISSRNSESMCLDWFARDGLKSMPFGQ